MKVTVAVEFGSGRTVVEQMITGEDFRGDYRRAVGECIGRLELSTYGPQANPEECAFDAPLQMGPTG
jgi:hypothetical protein